MTGRVTQAALDAAVVGRNASMFQHDVDAERAKIASTIDGKRILVVGGGGSIGSITTRLLLQREFHPRAVHVVDHSENYLAELTRDLHGTGALPSGADVRFWPIDFGGPIMARLIAAEAPYDLVLNFAAVKHVRSEKDVYAVLQMLDTNVVRQWRFKQWIVNRGGTARYFGVSTDKAANPTSLMGATKRLMEDVLFDCAPSDSMTVTSARFANVAFSNGSLLQSWTRRLELGQPLVVPRETRRYFVTLREAGEICLLANTLGKNGEVFIPRLDPARALQNLDAIAARVLGACGYEPVPYDDENAAREDVAALAARGRWPLVLTPLDTSGEKPYEEFVGSGESAHDVGLRDLCAVQHVRSSAVDEAIRDIARLIDGDRASISKSDIVAVIARAVPGLRHVETGRNLDQRM